MSTYYLKEINVGTSPGAGIAIASASNPYVINYVGRNGRKYFIEKAGIRTYPKITLSTTVTRPSKALAEAIVNNSSNLFEALTDDTWSKVHDFKHDFNFPGRSSTKPLPEPYDDIFCPSTLPATPSGHTPVKGPEMQLSDYDFECWLHDHLGGLAGLIPSPFPSLTAPPSSWQWCGRPQDSFDLSPFGFDPNTTCWKDRGTCDLTDATPIDPTSAPRRPKLGAVGCNFVEAKTTGGNTITITECSHALIEAALNKGKGIWIMICTDWTATTGLFHPENIIIIGPYTLGTGSWWSSASANPVHPSRPELRLEKHTYTLRFPNNGSGGRDFSLGKTNDFTLHFHRPHCGGITTTPPPTTLTYPTTTTGRHTTKLFVYD